MPDEAKENTPAEGALALAQAGLPVFPCRLDKSPYTDRGFYEATCDAETVAAWWRRWADALPAVPTGAASGLFVVDADIDKETGEVAGEATLAAFGLTPASHQFAAPTRSGGWHFIFRWREGLPGNTTKRIPSVDTRGEGGYAVAWRPETLIEARQATDLEEPPSAFIEAIQRRKLGPEGGAAGSGSHHEDFHAPGFHRQRQSGASGVPARLCLEPRPGEGADGVSLPAAPGRQPSGLGDELRGRGPSRRRRSGARRREAAARR